MRLYSCGVGLACGFSGWTGVFHAQLATLMMYHHQTHGPYQEIMGHTYRGIIALHNQKRTQGVAVDSPNHVPRTYGHWDYETLANSSSANVEYQVLPAYPLMKLNPIERDRPC